MTPYVGITQIRFTRVEVFQLPLSLYHKAPQLTIYEIVWLFYPCFPVNCKTSYSHFFRLNQYISPATITTPKTTITG